MLLKNNHAHRLPSYICRIFIAFIITFVISSAAYSNDNSTKWSVWMPLKETGVSWRYHCDDEPINGKYRAYFEFSRSDLKSERKGSRTFVHVRLDFEGYSSPVRASFHVDSKKDWRYMPYPLVKDDLKFTSRVGYSEYRKQPKEWSE